MRQNLGGDFGVASVLRTDWLSSEMDRMHSILGKPLSPDFLRNALKAILPSLLKFTQKSELQCLIRIQMLSRVIHISVFETEKLP